MQRTSAYVNDPGSPHHGRLGTLGKRVAGRQALHLPGGGHIWATATSVETVEPPAQSDVVGKYRIGDLVAGRTGPAKVVAGPVETPLGIVYRLEDQTSGHEFDEWEHNLSSARGIHLGTSTYGGEARVGDSVYFVRRYAPRDGALFREGDRVIYDGPAGREQMGTVEQVLKEPKVIPNVIPQPYQYRLRIKLDSGHTIPDTQGDYVKLMPKGQDEAPDTLPEHWAKVAAETDPDWSFVYYMGEVKLVEWSHQNRHRQILKDLLAENGKELTDDIDDTEIVGGTVTNGEVEVDGLAEPDLVAKAKAAITKELGGKSDKGEPTKQDGPTVKVEISIDGWDVKGD